MDGVSSCSAAFARAFGLSTYGVLEMPPGVFNVDTMPTVPSGWEVRGAAWSSAYGTKVTTINLTQGTIIRATTNGMAACIRLGFDDGTGQFPSNSSATVRNIIFDAASLAGAGIWNVGGRSKIIDCTTYRGTQYGINNAGDGLIVLGTWIGQNQVGSGLFNSSSANDCHFYGNRIQGHAVAGILQANGGLYMTSNHLFTSTVPSATHIKITNGTEFQITANVIEVCNNDQIQIVPDAAAALAGIIIASNLMYIGTTAARTADTFHAFLIDTRNAGSSINGCVLGPQVWNNPGARDLAILKMRGTNAFQVSLDNCHHNHALHIIDPASDQSPQRIRNCSVNKSATPGAQVLYSENRGTASLVGDGTTKIFTIAHQLDGAPPFRSATAGSQAAADAGIFYTSADSSNVIVAFETAPANGAGVDINWEASL